MDTPSILYYKVGKLAPKRVLQIDSNLNKTCGILHVKERFLSPNRSCEPCTLHRFYYTFHDGACCKEKTVNPTGPQSFRPYQRVKCRLKSGRTYHEGILVKGLFWETSQIFLVSAFTPPSFFNKLHRGILHRISILLFTNQTARTK